MGNKITPLTFTDMPTLMLPAMDDLREQVLRKNNGGTLAKDIVENLEIEYETRTKLLKEDQFLVVYINVPGRNRAMNCKFFGYDGPKMLAIDGTVLNDNNEKEDCTVFCSKDTFTFSMITVTVTKDKPKQTIGFGL